MTAALAPVTVPIAAHEVAALQRVAEETLPALLSIRVATAEDYTIADEILTDVVQRKDAAVAMRGSATKPMYTAVRTVEGWFRPLLGALERAEKHIKAQLGSYRVEQARLAAEARSVAVAALEAGAQEAAAAINIVAEAERPPEGRATVRWRWVVQRITEDLLPDDYWIPDRAKIEAVAAAAGSGEDPPIVPGVIFAREPIVGARR